MKEYLIKEWSMRITALVMATVLIVAGCTSIGTKKSGSTIQSSDQLDEIAEDIRVTATVPEKEPSFLEVLRTACRRDGYFMMMWEGKEEIYDCSPRQ